MGLVRLAVYLFIGYFVWQFVKNYLRKQELQQKRQSERSQQSPTVIVKCEQCQLHLPQNEALAVDGHWFCGNEHRNLWLKQQR